MEDSICSRRNLIATMFASVDFAFLNAVKLRVSSTPFTSNNFWIKIIAKPVKTSIIIVKHFSKIIYSELLHLLFTCFYGIYNSAKLTCCQGILA